MNITVDIYNTCIRLNITEVGFNHKPSNLYSNISQMDSFCTDKVNYRQSLPFQPLACGEPTPRKENLIKEEKCLAGKEPIIHAAAQKGDSKRQRGNHDWPGIQFWR